MIKRFIRNYPGLILAFSAAQLFLSVVFLAVIYYNCRTLQTIRSADETRAEAFLASALHQMELTAEDSSLSDSQKRLIFYGKSQSAAEALAGTGYDEAVKRKVTEALNGISRHMLEENLTDELLLAEERSLIRLFEENDTADACRMYFDQESGTALAAETEVKPTLSNHPELYAGKGEMRETANRLFGVRGILTEEETQGAAVLFSCKNAYALIHPAYNIPLEAAIYLPAGELNYTADQCFVFAGQFLEEVYPKKLYRKLSPLRQTDGDSFAEVVFGGSEGETVTVRISKSSGRMILLETKGLEHLQT